MIRCGLSMMVVAASGMLAACDAPLPQLNPDPGAQTSSLVISPHTLVADGLSQAWIVLHVRNRAGAPVSNVRAKFDLESNIGHVWLVQPGPTDSNGKTTGIILSKTPGTIAVVTHLPAHTESIETVLRATVDCVRPG